MQPTSQGVLLLLLFVLFFTAAGFAIAYASARDEGKATKGQRDSLIGVARLTQAVLVDIRSRCAWAALPASEEEGGDLVELGREVSACFPALFRSLGGAVSFQQGKLTAQDFAAAGIQEQFSRIEKLLPAKGGGDLPNLSAARRFTDLVAMLRSIQPLCSRHRQTMREQSQRVVGNPLLALLRDKASPTVLLEEVNLQVRQMAIATGREDPDAERGLQALGGAVVDVLCYRREKLKNPLTLGVLVRAVGGGVEQIFRECTADAEGGGWRPEYKAISDYIESLPGWDGRLPFNPVTRATHNAYANSVLRVLLQVT
jgi:hypothetical protein